MACFKAKTKTETGKYAEPSLTAFVQRRADR
jgi:hypothetical protein